MKCFGKKPARPEAVSLKFSKVFNISKIPVPPKHFGHENLLPTGSWGMLGNDMCGDCVWAGAAHEHLLWMTAGGLPRATFTNETVLSDYSAVTGYSPNIDGSDSGTDVLEAAAYRKNVGILDAAGNRHKIDAFVSIKAGALDQLALSTWLFGVTGVGVVCPASMEDQFDAGEVWDVVPGDAVDDGHYIPCVGLNSAGNFVFVSWGKLQAATPRWVTEYMDEGLSYLDQEMIRATTKMSRENFDYATLVQYLAAETG